MNPMLAQFHKLWGLAKDGDYQKSEWVKFQALLSGSDDGKIPDVLFNGNKVLKHLRDNPEYAKSISAIHVCDVLDAVVAIIRKDKP